METFEKLKITINTDIWDKVWELWSYVDESMNNAIFNGIVLNTNIVVYWETHIKISDQLNRLRVYLVPP